MKERSHERAIGTVPIEGDQHRWWRYVVIERDINAVNPLTALARSLYSLVE
ncbi:hypothetical protein [Synechococcus sp. PCC 7335]|uniref:hypothetical protein n=1 Tax=Synechococcus sp. (strain ATCC 29403 / PCC 7335) TaxID=91464 RepID=UPI0018DB5129|nr:hypothetical protein [Synechococcus sp. PCC 7335]